jgi:peptide/nickel transport system substrate-binding protein
MSKKRILGLLLAGTFVIGALAACAPATPAGGGAPAPPPAAASGTPAVAPAAVAPPPIEAGFQRGIVVVGAGETHSIAPAHHGQLIAHWVNTLSHNGLFRVGEYGLNPVPDLVYSWEALTDSLFKMRLHEGVMFHNGDIMTAYDVASSLEYVRRYPYQRGNQSAVVGWEVYDDLHIIIDTGVPNVTFFNQLAHQGNFIYPRSLIDAGHDFSVDPVGTGPFVFDEWSRGDFVSFNAFEDYFDQARFPRVGYINWRFVPEGASRTIALETGEADYVIDVALPDLARLRDNPNITVMEREGATYSYLVLNRMVEPFDNIHVRHAVDMALDREAMLIVSLDGVGIPLSAAVPTFFPGASTENTRPHDPEAARALLAEHNIDPATLGFEMIATDEVTRRRAEVVQANVAEIGILATITMMDAAAMGSLTQEETTWQAAFRGQTATNLPIFMRSMFHTASLELGNRGRHDSEELDALIDAAFVTLDDDARLAILEEISRRVNEHSTQLGTNMNIAIRAFNANLVVPELAANGFMYMNMIHWNE